MTKVSLLFTCFSLLFTVSMAAQAEGPYDNTFGTNGVTTIDNSDYDHRIWDLALQADGKIVLGGFSFDFANNDIGNLLFIRLNTDGSIDTTFGTNGFFELDYNGLHSENRVRSLEILPDGKILGFGAHDASTSGNLDPLVIRLNADGSLDDSFGFDGVFSDGSSNVESVDGGGTVAPDGNIVVAGRYNYSYPFISKIRGDGQSFDENFGTDGFVLFDDIPASSGTLNTLNAVRTDDSGNIYAAGGASDQVLVVKTNSTGLPDLAFGTGGILLYDAVPGDFDDLIDMIVASDGHLLGTGRAGDDLLIAKFDSGDGQPIPGFGTNGVVMVDIWGKHDAGYDIKELADGTIIVTGYGYYDVGNGDSESDIVVIKLNADGSLVSDWGDNGVVNYDNNNWEAGNTSVVQEDGNIVTMGHGNDYNTIVIRYENDLFSAIQSHSPAATQIDLTPNPVADQRVLLSYELEQASEVQVDLYSITGQHLAALQQVQRSAGLQAEWLDLPSNLTSGLYILRIQTDAGVSTKQLIIR